MSSRRPTPSIRTASPCRCRRRTSSASAATSSTTSARPSSCATTPASGSCPSASCRTGRPRTCARSTSPRRGRAGAYFAVAAPVLVEKQRYGVLVVATPKDELRERVADAHAAARPRVPRRHRRRGRARLVPLAADHEAGARACGRGGRGRGRSLRTSSCRRPATTRSATSPRRFGEMARRLSEVEELERNFLMTVSHELRTPLTAIRGHVGALREGLVEDPELRDRSLDVVAHECDAARAARRRRARPRQARCAPLHRFGRGGRHGPAARAGLRGVRRGGAAAQHRVPLRGRRRAR